MRSTIYTGTVKHKRFLPKLHNFKYKVQMFFIELNKINELAAEHKVISVDSFNLLSFNSREYLSKNKIANHLLDNGFVYTADNVFILTNLSYLGFCYNPVSFYYCFDESGSKVEFMLAEINNTPWDERYVYCFDCRLNSRTSRFVFEKAFHISPFMPMGIRYHWSFYYSGKKINIIMRSFADKKLCFVATLQLTAKELSIKSLGSYCVTNYLVTQRTVLRIYWQAFKLWLKRMPFYSHPGK